MSSVWNGTNIYNSKRKSTSQEAISQKTLYQLANLFESLYIKKPTARRHAARCRLVWKHKYCLRKRPNISKSIRKNIRKQAVCTKTKLQLEKKNRNRRGQETSCTKTCKVLQTYSWTQKLYIETYNHDVFCMKTHKCLQIYTTKCKSRGHLYENIISNSKITRTRICEYTRCTKTCHASQACSKTQILYKKTYNHDAFCTKTHKYLQI